MCNYFMWSWIKKPKKKTKKHTKLYHDRYFLTGLSTSGSIRYVSIFLFPYLSILVLSESNRNIPQDRLQNMFISVFICETVHNSPLHEIFHETVSPWFYKATFPVLFKCFCSDSFTLKYIVATSLFPLLSCLRL